METYDMDEDIMDILVEKFPEVLCKKIKSREIILPEGTKYNYNKIYTYRAIARNEDDFTAVSRDDFKSYFELAKKPKKMPRGVKIENRPDYYGVSTFLNKESVEQIMKFPNPNKKIAAGYVYCEGGPQYTNEEKQHVCWWLFEDADISGYKLV